MTTIELHGHDHAEHDHEHDHNEHSHPVDVQAWFKTAILFGLGVYFSYNIASGNLTNYINVRFAWLSYAAAALFLILGVFGFVTLIREAIADRRHDHIHDHDHDHDHHEHDELHVHNHGFVPWPVLILVAIPLAVGVLVPSHPLGAKAVDGNLSISTASTINSTTLTIPPEQRNVLDWLRAFSMSQDMTSFNNQPADVIGFVYTEPTFGVDHFMVARFAISCCVADASAIGVPVLWKDSANLKADTWVRVKGNFQVGAFRNDTVPVLQAATVESVPQPEHPYLYP